MLHIFIFIYNIITIFWFVFTFSGPQTLYGVRKGSNAEHQKTWDTRSNSVLKCLQVDIPFLYLPPAQWDCAVHTKLLARSLVGVHQRYYRP